MKPEMKVESDPDWSFDVDVTKLSTLMGACEGQVLYGYDTQKIVARKREDGGIKLEFIEGGMPSAEEIEQRYYKGPIYKEKAA